MNEMANMARCNHHCSVVDLAGTGVLIEGASGSGKTSLALGLLEAAARLGMAGMLVADDQVILTLVKGEFRARPPEPLRGLAELRGHGIIQLPFKPETTIGLVARLVGDDLVDRMPEPRHESRIAGLGPGRPVRIINLPRRHEAQGIRIVLAVLQEMGLARE